MALFDTDFLKKLEYLSLISKRVFRGSLLAQRRTMQMGAGIEFADHREYTPGDDLRRLDWKVLGRTGRSYLRLYQEETNLSPAQSASISRPAKRRGRSETTTGSN